MTPTAAITIGLAIIEAFSAIQQIAGYNNSNVKGAYGHLANASLPTGVGKSRSRVVDPIGHSRPIDG